MAKSAVRSSAKDKKSPAVKSAKHPTEYTSDGVDDHDVFLLPSADYQIMGVMTVLAAVIRLFRIYQPSSVVFDEVQYVPIDGGFCIAESVN